MLKTIAGTGALLTVGPSAQAQNVDADVPVDLSRRRIPKIRITKCDTIMTGRDIFVRLETDAGIVGYGDATNLFVPFSVEGMLKDLAPNTAA